MSVNDGYVNTRLRVWAYRIRADHVPLFLTSQHPNTSVATSKTTHLCESKVDGYELCAVRNVCKPYILHSLECGNK
jgi:hypothetical protein